MRGSAGLRILVADDNRDAAESLGILLQIDGHEITLVHDGMEALAMVYSLQPDVALLDIGMPQMDGYEIVRQIRTQPLEKNVTFIAITGWGQPDDKVRAEAAGFDHHLTKPIQLDELKKLLRDMADDGRPAAPPVLAI